MKFSVIIPAHNEASYLPECLAAIERAARLHSANTEIILVLNRCTDETEQIANRHGVKIIREDRRNLAAIRNTGARSASGDVLVTVDADSRVSENVFAEIERALESGLYVGGGVIIRPERTSFGIAMTCAFLRIVAFLTGLSAGVFWCRCGDFSAIGGFNEQLPFAEDVDFAKRLRVHGRKTGRQFTTLQRAYIVTSCRKFDKFGDWFFLKLVFFHGRKVRQEMRGRSTTFQDSYYYDFNSAQPSAGLYSPEDRRKSQR